MSLTYYERNADEFVSRTSRIEIPHLWGPFLALLPQGARILDIGCGSRRDSLYFAQQGFDVVAADPSPAMRKRAAQLTGKPVLDVSFETFDKRNEFDGIWACASLLHVKKVD